VALLVSYDLEVVSARLGKEVVVVVVVVALVAVAVVAVVLVDEDKGQEEEVGVEIGQAVLSSPMEEGKGALEVGMALLWEL